MTSPPVPPSANLRAELARAGLVQKDVAALLNRPQPQISLRLRGEIPWRITELQVIAAHLGIPIQRLIDDLPAPQTVEGQLDQQGDADPRDESADSGSAVAS